MSERETVRLVDAGGAEPSPVKAAAETAPRPAGLSPAEGLRLFKALTSIQDPTLRQSVIHMVELLAATGQKRQTP
jgi:hypothetical protein